MPKPVDFTSLEHIVAFPPVLSGIKLWKMVPCLPDTVDARGAKGK